MAMPIELIVLALGFIIIILGETINGLRIFKNLGAILLLVLSVVILSNGISGLDDLLTLAIGSICFGIGAIVLITDNFSEGEQEEYYSQDSERGDII